MTELIEQKQRKARIPHNCDYCGKPINRGEIYDWSKNIYDGTFFEWFAHQACTRVASAIWSYVDPDEGMTAEDFQEGCRDVCGEFICPGCKNYDKDAESCKIGKSFCVDKMDEFFITHRLYREKKPPYYELWRVKEREDTQHE